MAKFRVNTICSGNLLKAAARRYNTAGSISVPDASTHILRAKRASGRWPALALSQGSQDASNDARGPEDLEDECDHWKQRGNRHDGSLDIGTAHVRAEAAGHNQDQRRQHDR
jgi:hypothetical protein